MPKKTHNIVATVGKYMKDGVEKKSYKTIGSIIQGDDGKSYGKLDSIPLSKDWSGFVSFYPIEDNAQNSHKNTYAAAKPQIAPDFEDDPLPF